MCEIATYTNRFNDMVVLCPGMVTPKYKRKERYIWGLTPQIQWMVISSRPTTLDSIKRITHQVTDHGIRQENHGSESRPFQRRGTTKGNFGKERKKIPNKEAGSGGHPSHYHPCSHQPTKAIRDKCPYHHFGACREMYCFN